MTKKKRLAEAEILAQIPAAEERGWNALLDALSEAQRALQALASPKRFYPATSDKEELTIRRLYAKEHSLRARLALRGD